MSVVTDPSTAPAPLARRVWMPSANSPASTPVVRPMMSRNNSQSDSTG